MEGTALASQLKDKVRGQVYANEPMWRHTSFRIGGPADVLVVPEDVSIFDSHPDSVRPASTFLCDRRRHQFACKGPRYTRVVIKVANSISHIDSLNDGD